MKKFFLLGLLALSGQAVAFESASQASREFKILLQSDQKKSAIQTQAEEMVRTAFDEFFLKNEDTVVSMIKHYYLGFGELPLVGKRQPSSIEIHYPNPNDLEKKYAQACEEIKKLKVEAEKFSLKFAEEKTMNEKLYQELLSLGVLTTNDASKAEISSEKRTTIAQLCEKLQQALHQCGLDNGNSEQKSSYDATNIGMYEPLKVLAQRETDLKNMVTQWDSLMHHLTALSQKADAYEKIQPLHLKREAELKRVMEERDLLDRQLCDLHRKFEAEQTKSAVALNDARAQVEAVRNQLADVKNQLALAKKQQQQPVPKSQEVEKQLQAERLAYEGALSDERMQRQKLRQQVQELQKKLDIERAVYEKRIVSLEQEIVMLIDKLPANHEVKRTGSLPRKLEKKESAPEQKEEKKRRV